MGESRKPEHEAERARSPRAHPRPERRERMKVTAAKTMPRSCVRAPATRGARIATRMSAGKKTTSKVSNQVAAAAALTALTASAPALAAVNEVGQVAGAEFLPSVLVPLVGLVFPGIAMAASFIYLESEKKRARGWDRARTA